MAEIDKKPKSSLEKYYLPNLRPTLREHGKKFSDFMDEAKTPARRTWAMGTNESQGVTETTVNNMRIKTNIILKKWSISTEDASSVKKINN